MITPSFSLTATERVLPKLALDFTTAPAAAGNIGWVCTTAETPGTWKTFGVIAA
jgi:hypothetical protein